jgi:hypothetical protein
VTLVFGRIANEKIELCSDTQISDGLGGPSNPIPGTLKLLILKHDLCVGYAGPTALALGHIREVVRQRVPSLELTEVVRALFDIHVRTDGAVEFLVASSLGMPALQKIAGGIVSTQAAQYWVGDAMAATHFANLERQQVNASNVGANCSAMIAALDSLIAGNVAPSVGGLPILARFSAGRFGYGSSIQMAPPQQGFPGAGLWSVYPGTAASGGYSYVILPPTTPRPQLAVHFAQARFGYLYSPIDLDEPLTFNDVSHEEFVARIRAEHGIEVSGPRIWLGPQERGAE